jgi:hypothetical protein
VGATSGRTSRELSQYFQGRIACLAFYHTALGADQVRSHFAAAAVSPDEEGDRLFGSALREFHAAIRQHKDSTMLKRYASCLCGYLRIQQRRLDTARYVDRLLDAIRTLELISCAEGLAELISLLPDDTPFAVPLVKVKSTVRCLCCSMPNVKSTLCVCACVLCWFSPILRRLSTR